VGFNQHRKYSDKYAQTMHVPHDALPIPYTLTDFGRFYLAQLRAREKAQAEAGASHPSTERPRPRQ